jgi:MtN3 and saliva related transmembrane protein
MVELIGWFSSAILVLTITKQLHRQWQAGTSKGVSVWLFVGQCTASCGFLVYSVLIHNWVFVVTNSLLGLEAIFGLLLVLHHRRHEGRRRSAQGTAASDSAASAA